MHGFGGAKEDFADHLAVLAERHTVVTADHRGHGESDAPSDPAAYSFDRLVADMVTVAERVGLDRFRLLGHSMGGMVARRIVLVHPERVEALILMDTAPGPIPNFDAELMDAAADVALMQGKAALKELLDLADPLGQPGLRTRARRTSRLPGVPGPQVGRAVAGHVGRARPFDCVPGRRPPRVRDHRVPDTRDRRRRGHTVPRIVARDGRRHPGARGSRSLPMPATPLSSKIPTLGSPQYKGS